MFIPTTLAEAKKLGWSGFEVILVTGDAYIDSSYIGIAVIGHILMNAGYRVGLISQPSITNDSDITRLGEPALFWGVSGGAIDSMVANYTASRKKRNQDDFTPGGINNRRPDRAVLAYTNLIRRYFKDTAPILLGGLEASLRRLAHYDFWSNSIRRSILLDAKADYLLYGMADKSILEFAQAIKENKSPASIRGLCYFSKEIPDDFITLPEYSKIIESKETYTDMYNIFYRNNNPYTAKGLAQKFDQRIVLQNPPPLPLEEKELDQVYSLPFENRVHPDCLKNGEVRAIVTIKNSITTHRGCFGECNFCAITLHQGKIVTSRSKESIIKELEKIVSETKFNGIINDLGGPTANMYKMHCRLNNPANCKRRCLFPTPCNNLQLDHANNLDLLQRAKQVKGIKKIFIASGIRYDLILADCNNGTNYLKEVLKDHTSGQLKIAPEHTNSHILTLMGKPLKEKLLEFQQLFEKINKGNQKQYLTYYFIAAYPGSHKKDMLELKSFCSRNLQIRPEQVQIFTPTPSTYATLMYYTERDPFTGEKIFVEKNPKGREEQKLIITG